MNPQIVIATGMFVLSELLPFLPCKENSVVQVAAKGLNKARIIPDDVYKDFVKSTQNTTITAPAVAATPVTPLPPQSMNIRLTIAVEKQKEE